MKFQITEEQQPYKQGTRTIFYIERFDQYDRKVDCFSYLCRDAVTDYAERVKEQFPEARVIFRVT